jgi:integrase
MGTLSPLWVALERGTPATNGEPTIPELQNGNKPPRGSLPSMHSFRHTAASRALRAGESADEVAWMLGHKDSNVTRAVYVRELADARRRAMRRSRMVEEYGDLLVLAAQD